MPRFSLANIPIEVIQEQDEEPHHQFGLSLKEEGEVDVEDHVISIEENGQITIEQVRSQQKPNPVSSPKFPEWWLRLSSTFLSYLSTGYLVDLWLVCSDGEAVPAHQLVLAHSSPTLARMLGDARSEETVTLSLPDWDSDMVGQFVSSLYQGQLPAEQEGQETVQ